MKQTDRILVIFALIIGISALVVAVTRDGERAGGEIITLNDELKDEVRRLRDDLERVNAKMESASESQAETVEPIVVDAPPPSTSAPVQETVDDMRWAMTMRGMMPATPEHIARCRDLIFADGSTLREKLRAVGILRRNNQLGDEVVHQMIDVFHATDDPRGQQNIIRRLDDVRTPALADVLLQVSATSENSRVREEAVDSLSGYLPDPDLKVWLETVQASDPNRRVRNEADRLLKKYWNDRQPGQNP